MRQGPGARGQGPGKTPAAARLMTALDAVDNLFSDTSISPSDTLEALEELQSALDNKIDCLKALNPRDA